jgi:hypothetical protein
METPDLTSAWNAAEAALPAGWRLDGLRCDSRGLTPELRSDDWRAVAISTDGRERSASAPDPADALEALVASLRVSDVSDVSG